MENSEDDKEIRKHSVTIYLLKKGITFESALKEDGSIKELYRYTEDCVAYYKWSDPSPPKWMRDFLLFDIYNTSETGLYSIDPEIKEHMESSSASAILFVKREFQDGPRLFALTFGYGRFFLADDVTENRFGMRIALNSTDPDGIRGLRKTEIGSTLKNTIEQMPRFSNINMFDINEETDLIKQIVAKPEGEFLSGCVVTGSDTLKVSTRVNVCNLGEFLDECYNKYNEERYKEYFEWIDNIQAVDSTATVEKLNSKLMEAYNRGEESVWMAVPEIIDWDEVSYFTYGGGKRSENSFDDVEIGNFRRLYEKIDSVGKLKRIKIEARRDNGQVFRSWNAHKCFIAEIEVDDTYCLDDGKWYRISKDFKDNINEYYGRIPVSCLVFPDCKEKESESEYNRRVSEDYGAFLADAQNIHYGGGRSQVELCDLIFNKNNLVHVKKYSASNAMSHLFLQGVVSAELLNYDSIFRNKVVEKFRNKALGHLDGFDPSDYTITYAVISNKDDEPPHLPFFSRVAIKNAHTILRRMKYKVEIKTIRYG